VRREVDDPKLSEPRICSSLEIGIETDSFVTLALRNEAKDFVSLLSRCLQPREILGLLATGQSFAPAVHDRLFMPYDEFERRWVDRLNENIKAGKS